MDAAKTGMGLAATPGPLAWPTPVRWVARRRLFVVGLVLVLGGVGLLEGSSVAGGAISWLVGLVLLATACWGPRAGAVEVQASITRAEACLLAALFAAGLGLRVWAPEAFPNGIHPDEAAVALIALDTWQGRGPHPFGFAFIGDPAPFIYAESAFMAALGPAIGAVRVMAGLAGALTLAALWLLARPLFGPRVALVAVGLLALSAAHLHFSRMALNVVEVPLFGILALGLAWRGVRDGRPFCHLLSGMALGFGQYFAFGSRAFTLILAAVYGQLLLTRPRAWRAVVGGALLALLGLSLVLVPELAHARDDPRSLVDRFQFRSVFRRWDQAIELHGTTDPVWIMLGQARLNLLAFWNVPDRGPFYNFAQEPLLFGPLAGLFLIGLLVCLLRLRDPRFGTLLLWCAGVLAGGILSAGAPQFHRLLPMLPAACLMAAIAADWLAGWLAALIARAAPGTAGPTATALLAGLVGLTAIDGLSAIFVRQPAAYPWQPQTAWARWAGAQGSERTILLAGAPDVFAWDERVRMLARPATVRDLLNPTVDLPVAVAEGRPLIIALSPKLDDWLPLLRQQLPDAHLEAVGGPRGEPLLLAFDVPAGSRQTAQPGGLRGELAVDDRAGTLVLPRTDAALAFRDASKLGDGHPYRARWVGELLVARGGDYRFDLYTDGAAEMLLDGRTMIEGRASPEPRSLRADLRLSPGAHQLEIRYAYLRGAGTLELRWRPPDGERTLVPPSALRPG